MPCSSSLGAALASTLAKQLRPGARLSREEVRKLALAALGATTDAPEESGEVEGLVDAFVEALRSKHGVAVLDAAQVSLATPAALADAVSLLERGEGTQEQAVAVVLARSDSEAGVVSAAWPVMAASLADDGVAAAALRAASAAGLMATHARGNASVYGLDKAVSTAADAAAEARLRALAGKPHDVATDAGTDAALARACALAAVRVHASGGSHAQDAAASAIFHRCLHRLHRQHAAPGLPARPSDLIALATARLQSVLGGDEKATAATRVDITDALRDDAGPLLVTLAALARPANASDADATLERRLAVRVLGGHNALASLDASAAAAACTAVSSAWVLCFAAALRHTVSCSGARFFAVMEAAVHARAVAAAAASHAPGGGSARARAAAAAAETAAGMARAALRPPQTTVRWLMDAAQRGTRKGSEETLRRLARRATRDGTGMPDTPEAWVAALLPLEPVQEEVNITDEEAAHLVALGELFGARSGARGEDNAEELDGEDDNEEEDEEDEDEEEGDDGADVFGGDFFQVDEGAAGEEPEAAEEEEQDADVEDDADGDSGGGGGGGGGGGVDEMLALLERGGTGDAGDWAPE